MQETILNNRPTLGLEIPDLHVKYYGFPHYTNIPLSPK